MPLGDLINKIGHRAMFGDTRKEIDEYLRTATPDNILHDLHSRLAQRRAEANTQAIFDACSVQDSPQGQPYWTKESLQNHIIKTHQGATIPDASVDLLWSCFHFYAYHPFPCYDADHAKLERPAFERAITLLAFHGTEILGTLGNGIGYWRYNQPCQCGSNNNRIFRSISHSWVNHQPNQNPIDTTSFIYDDVMDVVAMTKPQVEKGLPSSRQLRPVAQRLLKGASPSCQLHINSLASLLGLFSRMKVHNSTWGRGFRYGSLEESSPQKEELVKILLQPFQLDHEGFLTPDSITQGLNILPNLEQHFHQLWATIFQPPMPDASLASEVESPPNSTTSDICRAVSLFVPPYEAHKQFELSRKFRPFSFEIISQSSTRELNDSLSRNHIIQSVAQKDPDYGPRLLLFIGDQGQSRIPEVIGAFFSRTSDNVSAKDQEISEKPGESKLGLPRLLFQLQPSFRLMQLNKAGNTQPPSHESAIEHVENPDTLYWIGDQESKVGLKVDTDTGHIAYVHSKATTDESQSLYEEIFGNNEKSGTSGETQDKGIGTSFAVTQIAVYGVEGGEAIASR